MTEPYIHGFSCDERRRLIEQARVLAPNVFAGLDFSTQSSALEIGCGVGAELKLMNERWPHLRLTGLDHSESHLAEARTYLGAEIKHHRVQLVTGDARQLPFPTQSFDLAMTIWMLEHVSNPRRVIRESLRVLNPDGMLTCTEVDNDSFGFDPENEVISQWWRRFNRYQQAAGGDPYVGPKLEAIAERLECRNIHTEVLPIISSRQEPARRQVLLNYLRDLLLSGAENMTRGAIVDKAFKQQLIDEFEKVKKDEGVEFQYHAVRLVCQPPLRI